MQYRHVPRTHAVKQLMKITEHYVCRLTVAESETQLTRQEVLDLLNLDLD